MIEISDCAFPVTSVKPFVLVLNDDVLLPVEVVELTMLVTVVLFVCVTVVEQVFETSTLLCDPAPLPETLILVSPPQELPDGVGVIVCPGVGVTVGPCVRVGVGVLVGVTVGVILVVGVGKTAAVEKTLLVAVARVVNCANTGGIAVNVASTKNNVITGSFCFIVYFQFVSNPSKPSSQPPSQIHF
jgi:hypothetical protein